jgi:hypothetical protein
MLLQKETQTFHFIAKLDFYVPPERVAVVGQPGISRPLAITLKMEPEKFLQLTATAKALAAIRMTLSPPIASLSTIQIQTTKTLNSRPPLIFERIYHDSF